MKINELKNKIVLANKVYREGSPIMSDQEFDDLVDEYQSLVSEAEFNVFRNSLHEVKGKVKHPFIMGSLDKLKTEEPDKIIEFIKTNIKSELNVSAKVDGISCRLHYDSNGNLSSASTRGNGEFGEDLTDKIKFVQQIPFKVCEKLYNADIRGELVILKNDFENLDGFANARNACAGIMNRKDWKKSDVQNVTFVAYTILGTAFTKDEQFELLKNNGFYVAWNTNVKVSNKMNQIVDMLQKFAEADHDYETDGVVICDAMYRNEAKYRPDTCAAVKINQLIATTRLIDIAWEGPSKDGYHIPVAILEPVELGGSTIARASLHNLDIIANLKLKYGSKVSLVKSGDIIPKITGVLETDSSCSDIEFPTVCNCCGSPLIRDGVNFRCNNENCEEQAVHRITHFIKKLGVKSASNATLKKLGILSIDDLISFVPNKSYKVETKLNEEFYNKVFARSEQELTCAMNFRGLSDTLLNRIFDHYGYDNVKRNCFEYVNGVVSIKHDYEKYFMSDVTSLPNGIGIEIMTKFLDGLEKAFIDTNKIINDARWHYLDLTQGSSRNTSVVKNGMSICFTGVLNTMGRTEAEKLAIEHGFEVKGVNRKLTYLVTNDPNTNSGKGKKARELGIKIISEDEFLKMVKSDEVEADLNNM